MSSLFASTEAQNPIHCHLTMGPVMDGYTDNTDDDPGLSLWLVPPGDSEIYVVLADIIAHIVPSVLAAEESPPQFEPHLTLTSHIPSSSITLTGDDPQTWLDKIDLPAISAAVDVDFQGLATGDSFFKKLFIQCKRSESLLSLAAACRKHSGVKFNEAWYEPHVSLL
jgi:hypothetical protein